MKIGTRLRITMVVLAVSITLTAIVLAFALHAVNSSIAISKEAGLAVQRILQLNQLTSEYEFRSDRRPLDQWNNVFRDLQGSIERLAALSYAPEDAALHDRLRHNSLDADELFQNWTAARVNAAYTTENAKLSRLLADSIVIRLRSMESVAQRLMEESDAEVSRQVVHLAIALAISLTIVASTVFVLQIVNRRVIGSLGALTSAIDEVEATHHVVKVDLGGKDEFSHLGDTLSKMTERIAVAGAELAESNQRMSHEISERHVAEARLREAIDTLDSGFAYFDADDRCVICNDRFVDPAMREAFETPVGHTFEELLGAFAQGSMTAAGARPDRTGWLKWRLQLHQNPPNAPWEIQWEDGTWFLVFERKTPDGGTVGLWTDITLRKRYEDELNAARIQSERQAAELRELANSLEIAHEHATRANMEKSRFLASMSHELRTPLTSIIGFADIMRGQMHGPIEPPSYSSYVDMIAQSGSHLLSLINDVLDISKIEAGKMTFTFDLLSPEEICYQATGLTRELAQRKQVALTSEVREGCDIVHGDARAVKQILLNLISNAIKFTEPGGWVRLQLSSNEDGVTMTVADSGIGMTEAELAKAMEPYGQVDSALSVKSKGTGLGLPLAKSLTELHGGHLTVESKKGVGTTISALLPWKRELAAESITSTKAAR